MKNSQDNLKNIFNCYNFSQPVEPKFQSPNQEYQQGLPVHNNSFGQTVSPRPGGPNRNHQMHSPNNPLPCSTPQTLNHDRNAPVQVERNYFDQSCRNFSNYHDFQLKSSPVPSHSYGLVNNQNCSNNLAGLATPRPPINWQSLNCRPNSNQHHSYERHSLPSPNPIRESQWNKFSVHGSLDSQNISNPINVRSSIIQHEQSQIRSLPTQLGHVQMRSPTLIQQDQIMISNKNKSFSNSQISPNKVPISKSHFNRQLLLQPNCKSLITVPYGPNAQISSPNQSTQNSNSYQMQQEIFPKYSGSSQTYSNCNSSLPDHSNIVNKNITHHQNPHREIPSATIISPFPKPCHSISQSVPSEQDISIVRELQLDSSAHQNSIKKELQSGTNLLATTSCNKITEDVRSPLNGSLKEADTPYSSNCYIPGNLLMHNSDNVHFNGIKRDPIVNQESTTIKVGIKDCLLEGGEQVIKRSKEDNTVINTNTITKSKLAKEKAYDNEIKRTSVIRKMPIPKLIPNCFVCPNCGVALEFEGALSCDRCGKSLKPKINSVTNNKTINEINETSHLIPVKDNLISSQLESCNKQMEEDKLSSESSEEVEMKDDQSQNATLDEPECLTLSSDEEEHLNDKAKPSAFALMPPSIRRMDQKGGGGHKQVESHSTFIDPTLLDTKEVDDLEDFVCVSSRNIHIGSFTVNSTSKVKFAKDLIEFSIPTTINGEHHVTLRLKSEFIVQLFYNLEGNEPVIFLYLKPTLANVIKKKLKLSEKGYNLNHLSEDNSEKRVILEMEEISEENVEFIANSFDKNKAEPIEKEHAVNLLSISLSKDDQNEKSEITEKIRISTQTLLIYPEPPAKGGITITTDDYYCLEEGEFLNDVILDFYLKYLMNTQLSQIDRERTHIFSTFFYKRLTTKPNKGMQGKHLKESLILTPAERRHAKVKSWTKGVDIFNKDFIIIPINERSHWFLAVICFPGLEKHPVNLHHKQPSSATNKKLSAEEKSKIEIPVVEDLEWSDKDEAEGDDEELAEEKGEPEPKKIKLGDNEESKGVQEKSEDIGLCIENPCILIFDSLSGASRSRIVATLRDYLNVEYFERKKVRKNFSKHTMKGACPKVPQQTNFSDCGIFTLQFAESFFEMPITNFSFPIRELSNWFDQYRVSCKRELIALLIQKLMCDSGKKNEITLPKLRFNSALDQEKVESKDKKVETVKNLTSLEDIKELVNTEEKKELTNKDKKEAVGVEVISVNCNKTPPKNLETVKTNWDKFSCESSSDVILDKVCSTGATFGKSKMKLSSVRIPKHRPTTPGPYKRIDEPEPTYGSPLASLYNNRPYNNFSSQSYQTNRCVNNTDPGRGNSLDSGGGRKSTEEDDVIFETEVLKPVIGDSSCIVNRVEINFNKSSNFKKPLADTVNRSFRSYNNDRNKCPPSKFTY